MQVEHNRAAEALNKQKERGDREVVLGTSPSSAQSTHGRLGSDLFPPWLHSASVLPTPILIPKFGPNFPLFSLAGYQECVAGKYSNPTRSEGADGTFHRQITSQGKSEI